MLKIDLLNFDKARYERKFVISEMSIHEVEQVIKLNPKMFFEIFDERKVNNIYLDSTDMGDYYNNTNGNPQRLKMRIRWYGELFGLIEKPVLEIKIKNNELGKKIHFPLKQLVLDNNFSFEYLHKEILLKSKLPKWLIEELKLRYPTLLDAYTRKYFCCIDKTHRITLDSDLIFFKIKNRNNTFNEKMIDRKNIILELKYEKKDDKKTANITKYFPFRLNKSSKYVTGLNLLNY